MVRVKKMKMEVNEMDEYWAARERAEAGIQAAKDAAERLIHVIESDPELAVAPAVVDRLVVLTATLMADLNAHSIGADFENIEWVYEEIGRILRAWEG